MKSRTKRDRLPSLGAGASIFNIAFCGVLLTLALVLALSGTPSAFVGVFFGTIVEVVFVTRYVRTRKEANKQSHRQDSQV